MALRYTDKPCGPQQREDWRLRFPANSYSMDTAPVMGSRPIKLYAPSGEFKWGLHHMGAWREVERVRDPYSGTYSVRMNGCLISNPVRWSSS